MPTLLKPAPRVAATATRIVSAPTGGSNVSAATPAGSTATSCVTSPTVTRSRLICTPPVGATRTVTDGTGCGLSVRMVSACPTAWPKSPNCQAVRGSPSTAFSATAEASVPNAEPTAVAVVWPPSTRSTVCASGPASVRVGPGSADADSNGPWLPPSRPVTVVRRRLVSVTTIRPVSATPWASSRPNSTEVRSDRYRNGGSPASSPAATSGATANPSPSTSTVPAARSSRATGRAPRTAYRCSGGSAASNGEIGGYRVEIVFWPGAP